MPLDINALREEKGADMKNILRSQAARFQDPKHLQEVIDTDKRWRTILFELEQKKKALNKVSVEFGKRKKAGESVADLEVSVGLIKVSIAALEVDEALVKTALNRKLNTIGNIVHESVPVGQDEDKHNKVVASWGTPRLSEWPAASTSTSTSTLSEESSSFSLKHHHELLWMIDGYEPERGAGIAGHRGYFLKGVGVLLNQALINYGLAFLMRHKYTALQPPFFMKREVMAETAQLEDFDEQLYKVVVVAGCSEEKDATKSQDDGDMYLIATSEQPISAYHRNEVLFPEQLPLRYAGLSTCFRKEAGSSGRDCWGVFRVHQFEKIEQFCIADPESSWAMLEEMIKIAQDFYQSLGLAHRVVAICSGALNNAAAKKYDLEAWFPTLGVYRELVSASNCTDYQSRAMDTKLGHPTSKKKDERARTFVHMLNATLCATERTMCCILENYQDGTGVRVPEVLRPFMGGLEHMPFTRPMLKQVKTVAKKVS